MKRRAFATGLGLTALAGAGLVAGRGRALTLMSGPPPGPPVADWRTGPADGDIAAVEKAWAYAVSGKDAGLGRSDALVVIQNGRLVFERYGGGHGPTTRHVSWSMAKSITHALVGAAVLEGKVDIDAPLITVKDPHPKLTLRALVTLTDGLDWNEAAYDVVVSDATQMLFGRGKLDGAAYTAAKRQAVPPLTRFNYSTGAFQLAAAELQARLFPQATTPQAKREAMSRWMHDRLFDRIGMRAAVAEFDPAGTFYGGSLVYASARDFARFGELYRLDGVWGNQLVLPKGWATFARTPTVDPSYGAGFWLQPPATAKVDHIFGDAPGPADAFAAEGHSGQMIVIIPSKSLVVVRLALAPDGKDSWIALGRWLSKVVAAFPNLA